MTPTRPTHIDAHGHTQRPASRRIKVTLPAALADKLDDLARKAGEPSAKVAAQMIRQAVDSEHPTPTTHHTANRNDDQQDVQNNGPPWLEPYGGSREWRGLTWGAIVGLHGRYPHVLSALKEGWWRNSSHMETLSASIGSRLNSAPAAPNGTSLEP
jgi:hypothetical protein